MESRNEKPAGRTGAISCSRAREYFYGFDGRQLSSEDSHNLSHHEQSCPACSSEFQEWRRVQSALQNSGITPAPDFQAGVMARIRETGQEPATGRSVVWGMIRQHGWARGLAAAAVVIVMLTGAAKLPAGEGLIAHLTRQVYIAFNPQPNTSPIRPVAPGAGQQPVATGSGNTISPAKTNTPATSASAGGAPETQPAQSQTPSKTAGGGNVTQVAKAPGVQPKGGFAVANKSLVISTTILKVSVADLAQARNAALDIANSCGAGLTSEQSAQDGNSNLLFIHFTVDPGTAGAFLDRLSSLGSMVSENTANNDVTGDYNRALEAYNDLLAQQAAADNNDQGQYTSQINFLKNELQNWSDASGKQVVMLWLIQ